MGDKGGHGNQNFVSGNEISIILDEGNRAVEPFVVNSDEENGIRFTENDNTPGLFDKTSLREAGPKSCCIN